jgi:hypothetical protein
LRTSLDLIPSFPFPVVIWEAQNIMYAPLIKRLEQLPEPDLPTEKHGENLRRLAEQLKIRIPEPMLQAA